LKILFHNSLGISDIANIWTWLALEITSFVSLRGKAAHRGPSSAYITIAKLQALGVSIKAFAIETDKV